MEEPHPKHSTYAIHVHIGVVLGVNVGIYGSPRQVVSGICTSFLGSAPTPTDRGFRNTRRSWCCAASGLDGLCTGTTEGTRSVNEADDVNSSLHSEREEQGVIDDCVTVAS